jgi:hypothetical protein
MKNAMQNGFSDSLYRRMGEDAKTYGHYIYLVKQLAD